MVGAVGVVEDEGVVARAGCLVQLFAKKLLFVQIDLWTMWPGHYLYLEKCGV